MKISPSCHIFFQEQTMTCADCNRHLLEISLAEALELSSKESFRERISGKRSQELPDAYKQYHVRSYLKDRSLFLDFDLNKNRLKKGRRLKRFFIASIGFSSLFNIPWLIFNIISTNIFHMTYTEYCPRCDTKIIKGQHSEADCQYTIEYFRILDDILSGRITATKIVYEESAQERRQRGLPSAYHDLFQRNVCLEGFWDMISVTMSILFWIYLLAAIGYPWVMILVQNLNQTVLLESRDVAL
jgi:hypothetical protein